jgi:hypothetical protein
MWEEEILLSLLEDLNGVRLVNQEDVWRWKLDDKGEFTVRSVYTKLEGLSLGEVIWGDGEKGVFDNLWKCPAPSKVVAFAWKAILNRVPTKVNLALRNVLGPDVNSLCGLCNWADESTSHLFLHCDISSAVWIKLMTWLNCLFISPPNLFVHWDCWHGGERNKNARKGMGVIWLATIWILWKARNDKVFNDINVEVDAIVDEVKVTAWKWVLGRMCIPVCLLYEWMWDPRWCLRRSPTRSLSRR